MAPEKPGLKIAFLGDSLTEGFSGAAYLDILGLRLPQHHLFNYGKGGDTVKSLFHRLRKTTLEAPFDITFLWVGVNDVLVHVSPLYPMVKRLRRQPWAENMEGFLEDYGLLLDHMTPKTRQLFTVSPLMIGEDLTNPWNVRLGELSERIGDLSRNFSGVTYINLRERFVSLLEGKDTAPFIPKSPQRMVLDMLGLKRSQNINDASQRRGLHFTIDGVHLNSAGASVVADVFQEKIRAFADTISAA
jgi:lysophospholipase L1-like esterase